jgi:hypothetical protein
MLGDVPPRVTEFFEVRAIRAELTLPAHSAMARPQKAIYVRLIDQGRISIHKAGDGRKAVFRPIGVERRRLVVVKIGFISKRALEPEKAIR